MALLTADGVALPEPSKYAPTLKDLDSANAYTSETGILVRDMIRANHTTISVSWDRLTDAQLSVILGAISGKESFQLTYRVLGTSTYKTGKFYATDRGMNGVRVEYDPRKSRSSLSCSLIEF